jgi:glutaredoxin
VNVRILPAIAVLLTALVAGLGGCPRHPSSASADDGGMDPPPLSLKEDSTGLLLTWIDAKGDFHVEQSVADVPIVGRDAVRVIDPMREDGTHPDRIFVADLRVAGADGTYPVRVTTRAEFDKMAEGRRQQQGPTLAGGGSAGRDGGPAPAGGPLEISPPPNLPDPSGNQRPTVIIYGASWCGPCHQAADYLRKKGVSYVLKDIEEDVNAGREMRAKLAKAGMRAGSIPVIDVRGKLVVGFSAQAVDEALGQAL